MNPQKKIDELGIKIPDVAKPAASYVPYAVADGFLYVSGQLPIENGEIKHKGIVGKNITLEQAKESAKQCAINLIACVKAACNGDLSKLQKVLHLQVLVASDSEFTSQHLVANGASDLFVEIFGAEIGSHTRAAYGIASIPLNACVEIAGVFKIG
ncbi:MAG: RidA family protein [Rickettsiales bacterium]|nr:RidA family protein [Rickettsiales bacterium]